MQCPFKGVGRRDAISVQVGNGRQCFVFKLVNQVGDDALESHKFRIPDAADVLLKLRYKVDEAKHNAIFAAVVGWVAKPNCEMQLVLAAPEHSPVKIRLAWFAYIKGFHADVADPASAILGRYAAVEQRDQQAVDPLTLDGLYAHEPESKQHAARVADAMDGQGRVVQLFNVKPIGHRTPL